ncbi:MAG: protease inhibitor I42 family protein [Elusimicrobia bacterium]|nr:protease inhibitor I42 family protein [Elusimicrobiota bacterium]
MKRIVPATLALCLTVAALAAEAPDASTAAPNGQVQASPKPSAADPDSMKAEIAVGESFSIRLPCSPTTGYEWELKSVDRKIAAPTGPIEFKKAESELIGGDGDCVLRMKGVKVGRTTAILVYRRSWEKAAPAKTFTAHIKVVVPLLHAGGRAS